jgi:hypothetical protein
MIVIALAALVYPALSAEANQALAKAPREIGVFLERRAECEHWGGEEPYDKARLDEINRAVRALRCSRIEADEKALRRKYAGRPGVIRLFRYD